MPFQKRFIINGLRLNEISSVDRPAQTGAVCVLIKSATGATSTEEVSFATIRKSADMVATGGKPAYPRTVYEDAMLFRADELAKSDSSTPEQAFAMHYRSDETLRVLAHAAEVASYDEHAARVAARGA
ncbi:MAG: hypothetical protein QOH81_1102 [Sphingomonadales bacterium]|nr:hypothetical protein [Sphingomonadales bacterium]